MALRILSWSSDTTCLHCSTLIEEPGSVEQENINTEQKYNFSLPYDSLLKNTTKVMQNHISFGEVTDSWIFTMWSIWLPLQFMKCILMQTLSIDLICQRKNAEALIRPVHNQSCFAFVSFPSIGISKIVKQYFSKKKEKRGIILKKCKNNVDCLGLA